MKDSSYPELNTFLSRHKHITMHEVELDQKQTDCKVLEFINSGLKRFKKRLDIFWQDWILFDKKRRMIWKRRQKVNRWIKMFKLWGLFKYLSFKFWIFKICSPKRDNSFAILQISDKQPTIQHCTKPGNEIENKI